MPEDTYFPSQWHLNNTGQSGGTPDSDIDAPEGWQISTGSRDIIIAIIDEGVDIQHEDLVDKLVDGHDFVEDDNNPTPWNNDAHGTACAGLAAAATNNETGVAGVAWGCKIMPIRIAYGYGGGWWYYDTWIAGGIQWAADNGADVLSNSWGGGYPSDAITEAVQYAKNYGRGGKGCVVVFAAGNSGSYVAYPAWLDEVIAVGATDHYDERWDYSNYGPELDVVAPSAWGSEAGVIFWTTDISGSAGYNNGDLSQGDAAGNYTKWFGGTSAATPQVAGLAALILSVNPDLTSDEVQSIIESTADDKGDPGWDQYYGWGRINVYKALIEAAKNRQILRKVDDVNDGNSVLPGYAITYTISYTNPPFGDPNYIGILTGVNIVDYLPDEVDYNSSSHAGDYNAFERTVTWNLVTLSPGDANSIKLTVKVNNLAEPLGKITNLCVLRADEIRPVSATEITDVNMWNPPVIYVDVNAPGLNNGLSWKNAYRDLQYALDRASQGFGSSIWVAEGTYKPSVPESQSATFEMISGIPVYGHFAGNETSINQRNLHNPNNETILTGLQDPYPIYAYNVVTATNVNAATILDGFTITYAGDSGITVTGNGPTITNCRIHHNNGFGIYSYDANLMVNHCTISDNATYGINSSYSDLIVTDCIIHHNGQCGIYLRAFIQDITIRNNTIISNGYYGIIPFVYVGPEIDNCIIWGHSVAQIDGSFNATYCCIQGGYEGNGNISTDPCFVDADSNDYHLGPNSPCIDKGKPNSTEPNETDLDGEDRVMDGDYNNIAIVDIGSDEYYWPKADFNHDEIVNFFDYALFAFHWHTPYADVNLAGDIDIEIDDLAAFCDDWLWIAPWSDLYETLMSQGGNGMAMQSMAAEAAIPESLESAPQPAAESADLQTPYVEPPVETEALMVERLVNWLDNVWLTSDLSDVMTEQEYLAFRQAIAESVEAE
jgi:parallel beta-helix repeat protein